MTLKFVKSGHKHLDGRKALYMIEDVIFLPVAFFLSPFSSFHDSLVAPFAFF